MKIIRIDNFGRESVSDKLIASNVIEYYGEIMVNELNLRFSGDYSDDYFRLVEDDYELYDSSVIY